MQYITVFYNCMEQFILRHLNINEMFLSHSPRAKSNILYFLLFTFKMASGASGNPGKAAPRLAALAPKPDEGFVIALHLSLQGCLVGDPLVRPVAVVKTTAQLVSL